MRRCLAFALLFAACPLAFAQAYKWKDAQGVTHYTDAPPPGKTKYETVKVATSDPAPAQDAQGTAAAAKPSKDAAGRADTPANREALCNQVNQNIATLQNEKVVTMDDGKGGVKQVDEATRQAELKKAQAQATLYCPA